MSTKKVHHIFVENPYDIQTITEAFEIAKTENKELLYLDRLVSTLKIGPEADIVNVTYKILLELKLIDLNMKSYI